MAGRVDQVELILVAVVGVVVQANALGFDGDAALALQIHGVEHLRDHFALGERAGHFEQAVGQRGLAVVDVRDDAEIADETGIHGYSCECATVPSAPPSRRRGCIHFDLEVSVSWMNAATLSCSAFSEASCAYTMWPDS